MLINLEKSFQALLKFELGPKMRLECGGSRVGPFKMFGNTGVLSPPDRKILIHNTKTFSSNSVL